jgi:hypothetical protein
MKRLKSRARKQHTMSKDVDSFLIVDSIFERYIILIEPFSNQTSVYCDSCDEWVVEWEGEHVSRHTQDELYEKILDAHSKDLQKTEVDFSDDSRDTSFDDFL